MSESFEFGGEFVWQPSPEHIENAHLTAFMRQHELADFDALLARSGSDVAWFTEAVLNYLDIQFTHPYEQVVDLSEGTAWAHWCVNGRMNIVHNCLDKYIGTPVETRTAFIWESEAGESLALTYLELFHQVNQAAAALRSLGLGKGDAVGIYMPMVPEIVVALLAIAKIGAVILPLFSGYGTSAVITRLADAEAKALITADGFFRRGKPVVMKQVADEAAQQLPSLQFMLVVTRAG
ncbi:MAG: AMP-binding protein, partial [Anaerolineales bacterium]